MPNLSASGKRRPDYLIIGGMKCGTTVLNEFIGEHPDVTLAKDKEIHYFSLHLELGEDWYASFFEDVPEGMLTGEASPTYLDIADGPMLPTLIHNALPRVRVIAIIKDPVERAISHFLHLKNVNRLPALQALDPSDVFAGDLDRKYRRDWLADSALWPLRHVLDFGNFFLHLHQYRVVFGSQLLVVRNEDLLAAGQKVMDRVFEHLGLEPFSSPKFTERRYQTPPAWKVTTAAARQALEEYYEVDNNLVRAARW